MFTHQLVDILKVFSCNSETYCLKIQTVKHECNLCVTDLSLVFFSKYLVWLKTY